MLLWKFEIQHIFLINFNTNSTLEKAASKWIIIDFTQLLKEFAV
jgi:hypothetical protein